MPRLLFYLYCGVRLHYQCVLTLAAELQGVQEPGEPTDRHRADQCRLQLVRLYQRRGAGEQQPGVVVQSLQPRECKCVNAVHI